jgi:two-component system sensor histidine kinase/response regulator
MPDGYPPATSASAAAIMKAADALSDNQGEASLLIVDDDPVIVQALGRGLRSLGRLRLATNGRQALALIAESVPDVVLLDAQMPDLSGFDVLDTLRQDPRWAEIPVIMITSHADESFERIGLEKGAVDFIVKPIRPAIVMARVQTQLRLRQANSALKEVSLSDRRQLSVALRKLKGSNQQLEGTVVELGHANDSLLQFVRIASHDLREPLNTISQFSALLDEDNGDALPASAQGYLQRVRRAADRMRTLLDDVVNYSKLEHGASEPRSTVVLMTTMEELRDALAGQLASTQGVLHIGPMAEVLGYPSMISLLFQNLISNGLKYVAPGQTPRVEVACRVDGVKVHVSVRDFGIGIAPQNLDRIFTPFARLHRKQEYDGSGLGLAIAQKIVQAHHGSIRVESTLGQGALFTVTLPLAQ